MYLLIKYKGFWEHTCGTLTMSREFFHSTINLNYVSYIKCYKWGISVNTLPNLITREKMCSNLLIRNYHRYNQSVTNNKSNYFNAAQVHSYLLFKHFYDALLFYLYYKFENTQHSRY